MADYVLMIALSPTMEEGTIQKWNKKIGDTVESGEVICEIETDKASMEYEIDEEGVLLDIIAPEGAKIKVGDPIAILGEAGEDIRALKEAKPTAVSSTRQPDQAAASGPGASEPPAVTVRREGRIKSSPLARKLAKKNTIDLSVLEGSGPGGRIVKKDIETHLAKGGAPSKAPPAVSAQAAASASVSAPIARDIDVTIPLSQKREITAKRLSESKFQAPHYYLRIKVQTDALLKSRKRINDGLKNTKISFNSFLIKLAANALKKHPGVNASWQGNSILQFGAVDIGLAVAVSDGLLTPVIKNADKKGILEIEDNLKDLLPRARESRLGLDEISGATFTISNLGSYGIDEFTAIINPPGSAILAVGKVTREPIVDDRDELKIKSIMRFSLSCDHRVIDGVVGAAFLKTLKEMMENPMAALL